jgi:hypothetical protein
MFKIEFIKADKVGGKPVEKGEVVPVSRSIRDAKIAAGVAKEATETVVREVAKKQGK